MRIKKLEIVGFKSFKDRTVIHFDEGITGIVGPNGCGKSNIVDALQWVMGEMSAKHLRGASMDNMIFQGSDNYAPSGMAEVTLVLENDGGPFPAKYMKHSEIQITRRLHRSGESEYLVNREPSRLRDIHEVFMDTGAGSKGFSIIEQGAIGKIVTAKPEERRVLIEEAAGITKFKARKRESQRKLVATDQNLIRLNDIIQELKRQLDSLQRQAKKATRYREIRKEAQELDLLISSKEYAELLESSHEARRILNEAQSVESEVTAKIASLEGQNEQERLQQIELEKKVETKQIAHEEYQRNVRVKEERIQEFRFEVEQAKRQAVMQSDLRSEAETRKGALDREHADMKSTFDEVSLEADRLEQRFEELNSRYQTVQRRLHEGEDEIITHRRDLVATNQACTQIQLQLETSKAKLEENQLREMEAQNVLSELTTKKADFESNRKRVFVSYEKERQLQLDIMHDVESFEDNKQLLETQVTERRQEIEEFKDKLNEVASRLYGLENLHANFEGFQAGVKSVMLWKRQQHEETLHGAHTEVVPTMVPVAEVVEVPQDYELAMEAALGTKLQLLLSENNDEALEAVDYLKESQSGRSSFLTSSEEGVAQYTSSPSGDGVLGLLKDVVKAPEKYENSVNYMLNGVVIVDTIRTALRLRPQYKGWTFVTKDGDTLTADGVLTGGTAESADSGVLKRRREIKELSEEREEWAGKLSLAQVTIKKMEERFEAIIKDLENAQQKRVEKEILTAELKKDLERADTELDNILQAVSRQTSEVNRLMDLRLTQEEKKRHLEEEIEKLTDKKTTLDAQLEVLENELKENKSGIEGLREEVTQLRGDSAAKRQEAEGRKRQLEMVQISLNEVNARIDRMSEETTKSSESMSENQILMEEEKVSLDRAMNETKQAQEELSQIRDQYERLGAELREVDEALSGLRKSQSENMKEMNESHLKADQSELRMNAIEEHIRERYMAELSAVVDQYKDREDDLEQANLDLEEARGKLKRMGEVNLAAIEEYDEIAERYEFLNQQYQDLVDAKDQLRKVIDRINRICNKRFKETYTAVNDRFKQVFPVLFGGGQAHLTLIENEDKSELGIDITACPPGKKPQSVTLLSGGEKALTAVSLIFSIFLVKPSPFCLLDEVDAPLDDANVYRFNDLVKEMAKRSQIILVTHNKNTMEINEKLYGVTMEERGVSKMVSVNISDAKEVVVG